MMRITHLFAIGTAALLAAACGRSQPGPDDAATRDLQLAPAAPYDQFASPQELGYQPAPGAVARPGPVYQPARPATTRTVQRSSGAVYRAPQKVTHTKRDAVIGAAAGAVTGAVIGRNVKGAVIGAAAGGLLGAVVGATVDVDHR
jgi:uncharacterized protein YcfJ